MKPFFSVIITSYNRKELTVRALNSLILQTETDWEAWIIDDGSIDETEKAIGSFLNNKIHYFYQENQGDAAAKNKGAELSLGRYITFLDSDDIYEKDHLLLRKKILEENPDIELIHGGVRILGDEYVPDMNNPNEKIHLSECVIGATFVFKKEAFEQLEGFELVKYGSDAKLFSKAEKSGLKILKISDATYVYDRTQSDSITRKFFGNKDE